MSSSSASCERHLDAGRRALSLGDLGAAETAFAAAIADAERADAGREHLAVSLAAQAQVLFQAKRYAEAAPLFERALECREHLEGSESAALVPALHNVAAAHLALGDSTAAEPLLRRALSILESVHGVEHVELAGVLNGLSQLCLKRGAHADAEPLLRRLLAIRRAQGEDRPEVATVMASLASVHHALAEHDAAEQLQRRVLEIRERTLAPNHYAIATTLEALAETCATRGKLEEALALLERSLDMRDRTLGASHPSLAIVRAKIADLQLQLSQDSFAVPIMDVIAEPTGLLGLADRSGPVADAPPLAPDTTGRRAPSVGTPPRSAGQLTDFRPPAALPTEPHPSVVQPSSEAFDAIRRLAAELNGQTVGASDARPMERSNESSLAISILPTGGALVLPGSERSQSPAAADESAWDDAFASEQDGSGNQSSVLTRPMVRVAMGAAALVVVAVSTTLALRSGDGSDELVPSGISAPAGAGQQSVAGTVALTMSADSADSATAPDDAESPEGQSGAVRNGSATGGASGPTTPNPNTRNTSPARGRASTSGPEAASLAADALPTAERLPGGLDMVVDATVPILEIGGAGAQAAPILAAPEGRLSTLGGEAYSGSRGFRPAAHIGPLPTPQYPTSLRQLRLRGEVVVSFTVDTNGRVDANTFRVVRATDMRFVGSVSEILPHLRFMPAEADGSRVTQVVQVPFRFDPREQ